MARTRSERLWMLGGGLGAVVVALGAYTFVVSPKASEANDLRGQAQQVDAQNQALQANLAQLQSDYNHMGALKAARDHIRNALPTDNDLSTFTDQLSAEARRTHVSVSLLTTGTIAAVTPAATAPVPAATSSGTVAAAPAPVVPPTGATVAEGLYSVPVSLTVSGSSAADTAFLHGLQHAVPRASLISSVVMNPAAVASSMPGQHGVSMSLTFQVFVEAIPSTSSAAPTPAAVPTPMPTAAATS